MLTLSLHSFLSAHRVNSSCQAQGARSKAEAQNSHRNRHHLAVQIFWRNLVIIAPLPSTVAAQWPSDRVCSVTLTPAVGHTPPPICCSICSARAEELSPVSRSRTMAGCKYRRQGPGQDQGSPLSTSDMPGPGLRARATCSNTSHNHISWIISTLQLQWWREVVRYV